eukprot:TRINITY_DN23106_c0_g1_i1.p1 TRINITY_DN23106_c0_g1~~TRINITY_DN23106_c0_g1_i1.p1  ORF type:complete len:585 (+),score=151.93 TRINITY_DN23106_c0_g1_i1:252-2006(+)
MAVAEASLSSCAVSSLTAPFGGREARVRSNMSCKSLRSFLLGDTVGQDSGRIRWATSSIVSDGTGGFSQLALSQRGLPLNRTGKQSQRGQSLVVRAGFLDQFSSSLMDALNKLGKEEKLTAENVKQPMAEIRRALLEADVSLPVVRRFVASVTEKAVGTSVTRGVSPGDELIKVVYDELAALMGGSVVDIEFSKGPGPTVILLAGLQGVGKTTACGKLALFLKNKRGKKVLLVAADVYRPAAIEQLITLGGQVNVPVFSLGTTVSPPEIARASLEEAARVNADVILVDTAGRLQVDKGMMTELKEMKAILNPSEILLVVDAMTGQEAAGLVSAFNTEVGITGAILTKVDGDSRGGAALSVKEVSGRPIKFVGEGEGMGSLEPFYPDRMAKRILGFGDILSLVEKAREVAATQDQEGLIKRMMESKFDFDDMLNQMQMLSGMGSISKVTQLLPGAMKLNAQQVKDAEKSLKMMKSMIAVMTPEERKEPELLARSPAIRARIAEQSGRTEAEVSSLVQQCFNMRVQMKMMMGGGGIPGMGGRGGPLPSPELMAKMGLPPPELALAGGAKKVTPGTAKRRKSKGFGK